MTLDFETIKQVCENEPQFRLKQIDQAIFLNLIEDWDEVTNLPKNLLEKLKSEVELNIDAQILTAKDAKSLKAKLILTDGQAIETVLMRHKARNTVCVSSQVGCALNCDFCATGKMGFKRNLSADEILLQLLLWQRFLKEDEQRVNNVVFMGMGEPFLNYDNVMAAIRKINDKNYFNIAARHISVSTVGIVEGIEKFTQENLQINLAVSLHASNDSLRKKIMPIAKKYSLNKLLSAIKKYIETTNRKVMIEYVLLNNVNDSIAHAQELSELLREKLGGLFVVNLISYNQTAKYKSSSEMQMQKFKRVLQKNKIEVVERYSFGRDINSACGQLAGK